MTDCVSNSNEMYWLRRCLALLICEAALCFSLQISSAQISIKHAFHARNSALVDDNYSVNFRLNPQSWVINVGDLEKNLDWLERNFNLTVVIFCLNLFSVYTLHDFN